MMDALLPQAIGHNTLVVLAGATALGIAAGMVGCFMVLRRRALVSDALSHATLPGIALAFLLGLALGQEQRSLPLLLTGAAISGVLAILSIQAITRWTRLTEDAAIGAVLSVFFGFGVVLLSVVQELPAANAAGLKGFIFGQTAAMRAGEAGSLGALALLAMAAVTLLYKEFQFLAFDEGFARATGWPAARTDATLMALVTLITVVGLQTVGLVLIIALLITPATAARFWTNRLGLMLAIAGFIGGLSGGVGALLSARFQDLPAGAVIVLVASFFFLVSLLLAPARGLAGRALRRARLKARLAAGGMVAE